MSNKKPEVQLVRGSEAQPKKVEWLWKGWLAESMIHILGGSPGAGKTTLCMEFASKVTTGEPWPDGTIPQKGNVVIWSGEDDRDLTLLPKLIGAGADRERVFFVDHISTGRSRRSFDPSIDLASLQEKMEEVGNVRLLIIDSIASAVSGDSHKNTEVRRSLQPLVDLASTTGCAVLGVTHFTKGTTGNDPIDRITGSLAFGALARIVLVAAKDAYPEPGQQDKRVLCKAKANICRDEGGFEYFIEQATLEGHKDIEVSRLLWGEGVEGSARQLLGMLEFEPGKSESPVKEAKKLICECLSNGPMPQFEIKEEAERAGISWTTMNRAKKALGVLSEKNGFENGWSWRLAEKEVSLN